MQFKINFYCHISDFKCRYAIAEKMFDYCDYISIENINFNFNNNKKDNKMISKIEFTGEIYDICKEYLINILKEFTYLAADNKIYTIIDGIDHIIIELYIDGNLCYSNESEKNNKILTKLDNDYASL